MAMISFCGISSRFSGGCGNEASAPTARHCCVVTITRTGDRGIDTRQSSLALAPRCWWLQLVAVVSLWVALSLAASAALNCRIVSDTKIYTPSLIFICLHHDSSTKGVSADLAGSWHDITRGLQGKQLFVRTAVVTHHEVSTDDRN